MRSIKQYVTYYLCHTIYKRWNDQSPFSINCKNQFKREKPYGTSCYQSLRALWTSEASKSIQCDHTHTYNKMQWFIDYKLKQIRRSRFIKDHDLTTNTITRIVYDCVFNRKVMKLNHFVSLRGTRPDTRGYIHSHLN